MLHGLCSVLVFCVAALAYEDSFVLNGNDSDASFIYDSVDGNADENLLHYRVQRSQTVTKTNLTITVQQDSALHLLFTNSYLEGEITFHHQNGSDTVNKIDSSNDENAFRSYLLTPLYNFTMTAVSKAGSERWMSASTYTVTSDIGETKCPSAGNNSDTPIEIEETKVLYSDFYQENKTRAYPKQCHWVFAAPLYGWVTVVRLLYYGMTDNETLFIQGSYNGTSMNKKYDSITNETVGVMYYDSTVNISYNRPTAVDSSSPAFRILVDKMKIEKKNCSIPYNGKHYTAMNGSFTNMKPSQQYPKNEYCSWTVNVPLNATFEFCYFDCNFGKLSGDELTVEALGEVYHYYKPNKCFILNENSETYNVTFVWESDGVDEYNGFRVDYNINLMNVNNRTGSGVVLPTIQITLLFSCLLLCIFV